ncbi:MAG: hypothetical protein OEY33_07715 [Bdellovibrionales bacterium]|nr:hypothetical protein [Bdellovibrionales bacterium]
MNKKGTIGILQITRFGDLIQTLTACKELKEQYPEYELLLICRESFGKPLEFILNKTFDKIIYLNLKEIIETPKSIQPGIKNISNFIENINNENLDILINLSWSLSSQYIATMIKAKNYMGLKVDRCLRPQTKDSWSTLVFSSVMRGLLNPFNIIDIYKGILGVKRELHAEVVQSPDLSETLIFHPFASQEEKTWSIDKWVEIIYQLLKKNPSLIIHIVGSKKDHHHCESFIKSKLLIPYQERIKMDIGTRSIENIYELALKSRLFVGSDSMVGQLCAFAGLQTLTLSKGSVRPHETTPYGSKNYNIMLKDQKRDLPYNLVIASIQQLIEERAISYNNLKKVVPIKSLRLTNIYESYFSREGFLSLKELQGNEDLHSSFRIVYKILWAYYINNIEINCTPPKLTKKNINQLKNYLPAFEQLFELIDFGKKYSLYIYNELEKDSPEMNILKEYSEKLTEIDHLQIYLRNNFPLLGPIVDFFTVKKANLSGSHIEEIAGQSVLIYEDYSNLISALYELVINIIKVNDDDFKKQISREVNE